MDFNDEIISIEQLGNCDMLDIEVSDDHLFYANDILTKNSLGLAATADFMSILGTNDDDMVYESELCGKIVKNRLGGRVGENFSMYYDSRTLKMYDESELEKWLEDATITGDTRDFHEATETTRRGRGNGN